MRKLFTWLRDLRLIRTTRPHHKILSKKMITHDARRLAGAMLLQHWGMANIKLCITPNKPRPPHIAVVIFPCTHIWFHFGHRYQWTELLVCKRSKWEFGMVTKRDGNLELQKIRASVWKMFKKICWLSQWIIVHTHIGGFDYNYLLFNVLLKAMQKKF